MGVVLSVAPSSLTRLCCRVHWPPLVGESLPLVSGGPWSVRIVLFQTHTPRDEERDGEGEWSGGVGRCWVVRRAPRYSKGCCLRNFTAGKYGGRRKQYTPTEERDAGVSNKHSHTHTPPTFCGRKNLCDLGCMLSFRPFSDVPHPRETHCGSFRIAAPRLRCLKQILAPVGLHGQRGRD